MRLLAVLALAVLALGAVVVAPAHPAKAPAVIGHRGAPAHRPENTLAGFGFALAHGAQAVELDVRVTRDEVPVVVHDAVLPGRCTGPAGLSRRVAALSFAELERFDCGAADPAFPRQQPVPGARVPRLVDVLALPGVFVVEVKADDAPVASKLARLVVTAVEAAHAGHRAILESFDVDVVRALSAARPDLARGLLVGDDVDDAPARAEALGCRFLSPAAARVDRALVDDAHARGVAVAPWTVNDDASWRRLAALGVDGIVTDDPPRFAASALTAAVTP